MVIYLPKRRNYIFVNKRYSTDYPNNDFYHISKKKTCYINNKKKIIFANVYETSLLIYKEY